MYWISYKKVECLRPRNTPNFADRSLSGIIHELFTMKSSIVTTLQYLKNQRFRGFPKQNLRHRKS